MTFADKLHSAAEKDLAEAEAELATERQKGEANLAAAAITAFMFLVFGLLILLAMRGHP